MNMKLKVDTWLCMDCPRAVDCTIAMEHCSLTRMAELIRIQRDTGMVRLFYVCSPPTGRSTDHQNTIPSHVRQQDTLPQ